MPSKTGLIIPGDKEFRFGPEEVNRLHDYSDKDSHPDAQHHSLGTSPNQAASGNHGSARLGWTIPTLQNGWVDYDADPNGLWHFQGFTKCHCGWVSCQGLIKNGTATSGTLIWTMPPGFRPKGSMHIPAATNGVVGVINVMASGSIQCNLGINNLWLSTDNICYQAVN